MGAENPEMEEDGEAVAGVIIALLGSTLQAVGLTLMKRHLQHALKQADDAPAQGVPGDKVDPTASSIEAGTMTTSPPHEDQHSIKVNASLAKPKLQNMSLLKRLSESTLWFFGFFLFLVGNIGDFVAFGLVSQMMVTLIGSWGVVVNTFTAHLLLGEKTSSRDVLSATCIVVGISFTVIFGGGDSEEWTTDELIEQYKKRNSIIMFAILLVSATSGFYVIAADYYRRKKIHPVPAVGRRVAILYCLMSALVGCITVSFGSATSGILKLSLEGENQFTNPVVGVLVALFLLSLPTQMILINLSLATNDALFHIPNYYVFWNLGSIITGAVFYEEMSGFDLESWIGFCAGVLILFLGVYLTTSSQFVKAVEHDARRRRIRDESLRAELSTKATRTSNGELVNVEDKGWNNSGRRDAKGDTFVEVHHGGGESSRAMESAGVEGPKQAEMLSIGETNSVSGISRFVGKNRQTRSRLVDGLFVEDMQQTQDSSYDEQFYGSSGPKSARRQAPSIRRDYKGEKLSDMGTDSKSRGNWESQDSTALASRGDISIEIEGGTSPRDHDSDLPGSVSMQVQPLFAISNAKSPKHSEGSVSRTGSVAKQSEGSISTVASSTGRSVNRESGLEIHEIC